MATIASICGNIWISNIEKSPVFRPRNLKREKE